MSMRLRKRFDVRGRDFATEIRRWRSSEVSDITASEEPTEKSIDIRSFPKIDNDSRIFLLAN